MNEVGAGRIVVVGGEKGGTAKTTTAINLAAVLASKGRDTVIVDTDRQASASDWGAIRDQEQPDRPRVAVLQKFGPNIARELQDLRGRYQEIIVDAGGRDSVELRSAMLVADVLVSPFQASNFDLWTVRKLDELYSQVTAVRRPDSPLHVICVLSRANTNPSVQDGDDARELMSLYPHFNMANNPIRDRVSFKRSGGAGLGVCEYEPKDEKAAAEIMQLFTEVYPDLVSDDERAPGHTSAAVGGQEAAHD